MSDVFTFILAENEARTLSAKDGARFQTAGLMAAVNLSVCLSVCLSLNAQDDANYLSWKDNKRCTSHQRHTAVIKNEPTNVVARLEILTHSSNGQNDIVSK